MTASMISLPMRPVAPETAIFTFGSLLIFRTYKRSGRKIRFSAQNHFVSLLFRRNGTGFNFGENVLLVKVKRDATHLNVAVARIQVIRVVPTIAVKLAFNEGLSHQEEHLLASHADLQLVNHFFCNQIALVDIGTVDVAIEVAAGQRDQTDGKWSDDTNSAQGHEKNGRENASRFVNWKLPVMIASIGLK